MLDETTIKLKKNTRDVIKNIKKVNSYNSYDTLINVLIEETNAKRKALRKRGLV